MSVMGLQLKYTAYFTYTFLECAAHGDIVMED